MEKFILTDKLRMGGSSLVIIFRASNFLEFMWPSFAVSQFFGLFPYKINRGILSASIPGYVYSGSILTILTLIALGFAYCMNFTKELNFESRPALLQSDCYIFIGYSYCLVSFILSNQKLKLYKKMAEISSHVKKSRWNKAARFIHGKDIIGFLFLIGQMPNTLKGKISDVAVKLIYSYITLVICLLDNQFINCVLATKIYFQSINYDLKIFEDKITTKEEFCSNAVVGGGRFFQSNNAKLNFLIDVRSIRKKYEDLCAVVQITNEAFSIPCILSLGLTFAEVTFSLYFYILKSIGEKEINLEKQIWYYYFITSAAYYTSKFLFGVWACETTKNEAEIIKVAVHRILTNIYDKEITHELQSFSLQMVQRNVSYSAHGISLDGSLVSGVATGISTYLLILIQFLIADRQCEIKKTNQ